MTDGPAQDNPTIVGWRRTDERSGHSVGRLARRDEHWVAQGSEVLADGPEPFSCHFTVELDAGWITRDARITCLDRTRDFSTTLVADRSRRWTVAGEERPDLDGYIDIDIAATPLTNTFPIRRLQHLPIGASSTSPVAWVEIPSMRVVRVEQTYRRLGERDWEYSDPTHGAFVLGVDREGLVIDYQGFATRIR
ncbi:glycolipid-binding family protein [Nakamurella sp. YIM 132087]|uniref:Glycolipid-binding family protein n=1 Tax=Nakamurella alba TaxID=2665158 RepID=A0A7K1FNS4_9ACTN|nr:putative glycolipid-binding domain-containing protein [Nakamurella alba]MTD14873.1 glycolipid-binding family protein [Nakamurella alba]